MSALLLINLDIEDQNLVEIEVLVCGGNSRGLAWATTDQSLEQAFSQYDKVIESKIINDRETGRSRGFGFVTFKDEQSMREAIDAMNGQELDGRNITVNEAQSHGNSGGLWWQWWIPWTSP
ncbi:hypothetical protein DH2020_000934 [Rehmannia glutinosa]|uniref:RRM domain-containing protein n=1 Tax=Rehmannia glutinosa TaxID=99300 RepID=A0ABR0XYD4_REHGL